MKSLTTIYISFLLIILNCSTFCFASEEIVFPASTGEDITIDRFQASGKHLILWLAPEYGFRQAHRHLAQQLSDLNIEIWQTNIIESLFLPQGTSSIKQLNSTYVSELIEYAHKVTGKQILLAGDSYAAISVLEGAHDWQQHNPLKSYLIGAVLFTPYTFAYIPPLGASPEYMPVISATNIPLMIFQAKNSPIISQFDSLLAQLRQHNTAVYTKLMPDIMSLFYEKTPTAPMIKNAKAIPANIQQMITVLESQTRPLPAIPLRDKVSAKSGIDIYLKEFNGHISPSLIQLYDINGKIFSRNDFKGKVTLVNFWATWCPPCIEEIPSLNRLKVKMKGKAFEIVSINYAEDKTAIADFMQKVDIDFPVLLDQNGEFAKRWNVISYPSTFVIDPQGRIRYGVNAAIEWDSSELIEKLNSLY